MPLGTRRATMRPGRRRPDRMVLHAGLHKTGSTLLQSMIRANRDQLEELGYGAYAWRGFNELLERSPRLYDRPFRRADVARAAETFRSKHPEHSLVYSEEALLGPMVALARGEQIYRHGPDVLASFVEEFGAERPVVVLYLRRQDQFIESVYLQLVKMGVLHDDFPTFFAGIDLDWFRWDVLIERLEEVLPRSAEIRVKYFESIKSLGSDDFCRDFAREIDPRFVPELGFDTSSRNRGYSAVALDIARVANPQLDRAERQVLRRFLDQHFTNATHPAPVLMDDSERLRVLEHLAESNTALHDRVADGTRPSPYLPHRVAGTALPEVAPVGPFTP